MRKHRAAQPLSSSEGSDEEILNVAWEAGAVAGTNTACSQSDGSQADESSEDEMLDVAWEDGVIAKPPGVNGAASLSRTLVVLSSASPRSRSDAGHAPTPNRESPNPEARSTRSPAQALTSVESSALQCRGRGDSQAADGGVSTGGEEDGTSGHSDGHAAAGGGGFLLDEGDGEGDHGHGVSHAAGVGGGFVLDDGGDGRSEHALRNRNSEVGGRFVLDERRRGHGHGDGSSADDSSVLYEGGNIVVSPIIAMGGMVRNLTPNHDGPTGGHTSTTVAPTVARLNSEIVPSVNHAILMDRLRSNPSASYAELRDLEKAMKASIAENVEAAAARERLRGVLQVWGLREEPVAGDNNCLFHALVLQLRRIGVYNGDAESLRLLLTDWMRDNADIRIDHENDAGHRSSLCDFVTGEWGIYLARMARHGGSWGDHCVLTAAGLLRAFFPCMSRSFSPSLPRNGRGRHVSISQPSSSASRFTCSVRRTRAPRQRLRRRSPCAAWRRSQLTHALGTTRNSTTCPPSRTHPSRFHESVSNPLTSDRPEGAR